MKKRDVAILAAFVTACIWAKPQEEAAQEPCHDVAKCDYCEECAPK